MRTNAVLPNSPMTNPMMASSMASVYLETGWVVAFCSIRVVLAVEPFSSCALVIWPVTLLSSSDTWFCSLSK